MSDLTTLTRRHGHWLVVGVIGACAVAVACGSTSNDIDRASDAQGAADGGSSGSSGAGAVDDDDPDAGAGNDGTSSSSGALPPDAGRGDKSTDANLRVAFIGDTASGADFKKVLALVKAEKAQLVMIQGDLTYDGEKDTNWFPAVDGVINKDQPGSAATVTIPYILAKGNHDVYWPNIATGLATRYKTWGVDQDNGSPTARNYTAVYKGLRVVMVDQAETTPTRANYIDAQLKDDTHVWKICSWHKNMRATNLGPKNNEMPWATYETCRAYGAIVAQGHSHTYSRSKTVTNDTNQTVDPTCSDPYKACVGPGKHFFFDSSLGGHDIRDLEGPTTAGYWAGKFSGTFGALFIDFNVDGDPKKARGYFKTVGGTIVDPPASSGKTSFEITSTN